MKLIRKITVGAEYKNDAMHFTVDKPVSRNNWKMKDYILKEIIETKDAYELYIMKGDEVLPWKSFNKQMAISVEYDIDSYEG